MPASAMTSRASASPGRSACNPDPAKRHLVPPDNRETPPAPSGGVFSWPGLGMVTPGSVSRQFAGRVQDQGPVLRLPDIDLGEIRGHVTARPAILGSGDAKARRVDTEFRRPLEQRLVEDIRREDIDIP